MFEPVANPTTTPARLTFRVLGLDPADNNDVPDVYAAEVAHPGDPQFVHLETSGTANAAVEAGPRPPAASLCSRATALA